MIRISSIRNIGLNIHQKPSYFDKLNNVTRTSNLCSIKLGYKSRSSNMWLSSSLVAKRYRTTAAKIPTEKADRSSKKINVSSNEYKKLFRLSKPEIPLLACAFGFLLIGSGIAMSVPYFIGTIIDNVGSNTSDSTQNTDAYKDDFNNEIMGLKPYQFYGSLLIFFGTGAVVNFGRVYLLRLAGERLIARLRSRLYSKILSSDSYFFDIGPTKEGMKTGDLISRITSDTQLISKTLSTTISDGLRSTLNGFVGLSMMFYVSWRFSMYMCFLLPIFGIMPALYGTKIKMIAKSIQENLGSMTKVAEEKLNGIRVIQSFAKQKDIVHEFNQELRNLYRTSIYEGKLTGTYSSINAFLGNMTFISLLVIGNFLIQKGQLTIGELSSFMMYALYTGGSMFGIANFYSEVLKGVGASGRVFELIESEQHISPSKGKKVDVVHGDIVFENLKFAYPSRPNSPIFGGKMINLCIKQGENVCFVGPSGSGKSSISQLLLRFYDPTEGRILVNGEDIKDLNLNFYRSHIGYVQQESVLFSGTIRDNITFGKKDASDEQIKEAAMASNSLQFIEEFPDKFDTLIGSSNSNTKLSGGQRQRISLARTLIMDPKILILDEATSALDSHSEEIVMKSLKKISSERDVTLISIAHRLSTIRNSDRIIVLSKEGEILDDGKFNIMINDPSSALNALLRRKNLE